MWPFSKPSVEVASRDKLLPACDALIEQGRYITALNTAEDYKRNASKRASPSPAQEAVNMAYAHHAICKAAFFLITDGKSRTYKNYYRFFFANVMTIACLQAGRGSTPIVPDLDGKISDEREHYYRELYRLCDGDPNVERADADANRRVSEMMDASPFFWC